LDTIQFVHLLNAKRIAMELFFAIYFFVKILFSNLPKCSIESEAKKAGMESLTRRDSPKKIF
jgi:hypothetical protein